MDTNSQINSQNKSHLKISEFTVHVAAVPVTIILVISHEIYETV